MSTIDDEPSVDERPINSLVRQNSLEKHLQQRPNPQDLKDKHILLDTNAAPALQSAQQDLQRQKITDSLKKGLEKRPEREDLVERNILPDSIAAPGISGPARSLQKHMRADALNGKIAARPDVAELVEKGVLQKVPASSDTQGGESEADALYRKRIEDEYAKREGGA